MTSIYDMKLPEMFPYQMVIPEYNVDDIVKILNTARRGAPNGSSFAVTSDTKAGARKIWLSKVSYDTLVTVNPTLKNRATMAAPENHEYVPAERVGNPCEICGFGRHHPWHGNEFGETHG